MSERYLAFEDTHKRAEQRVRDARGSIYIAFDSLDCGFNHNDAWTYLEGSVGFQSFSDDARAKIAGLCMGFAITAIEYDREKALPAGVDQPAEREREYHRKRGS